MAFPFRLRRLTWHMRPKGSRQTLCKKGRAGYPPAQQRGGGKQPLPGNYRKLYKKQLSLIYRSDSGVWHLLEYFTGNWLLVTPRFHRPSVFPWDVILPLRDPRPMRLYFSLTCRRIALSHFIYVTAADNSVIHDKSPDFGVTELSLLPFPSQEIG